MRCGFLTIAMLCALVPTASAAARTCPIATCDPRLIGYRTADATAVEERMQVDGRLDEAAWATAERITGFMQSRPTPGAASRLRTEASVVAGPDALYVGVWRYDRNPRGIVAPYLRRDNEDQSDWVFVEIDSRADRRTAFSFGLNPRSVQVDGVFVDDVNYDVEWSGVWEGAARVGASGWTAEFRIPFSELAFADGRAVPLAAVSPEAPCRLACRRSPGRGSGTLPERRSHPRSKPTTSASSATPTGASSRPIGDTLHVVVDSDTRRLTTMTLDASVWRERGSSSSAVAVSPLLSGRVADRVGWSIGPGYSDQTLGWYLPAAPPSGQPFFVRRLRQHTVSLVARADVIFDVHTLLQVYVQPFVSSGRLDRPLRLIAPRASRPAEQFAPVPWELPGDGSTEQALNATVVFRWEYRPASFFTLAWNWRQDSELPGRASLADAARGFGIREGESAIVAKTSVRLGG